MSKSEKALPADLKDLDNQGDDFGAMLDEFGGLEAKKLKPGEQVEVKIIQIGKDSAFCQISASQEGAVPITDISDDEGNLKVKQGDTMMLYVTSLKGGIELRAKLGGDVIDIDMLEEAKEHGLPLEGTVTGTNKGGLEVSIGNARAFCPIGQADLNFVEDPAALVGKTFEYLITEIREGGRSIVVSRKRLLEERRQELAQETLANLEQGARVHGIVTRTADFGAFVDIGGIDGLIPLHELSWGDVASAKEIVNQGDEVEVEILKIEPDPKRKGKMRIGLSLKKAQPDPFNANVDRLGEGSEHEGKVVRVEKYGAFVELLPGVQGLIHVSELSNRRVRHPSDVVEVGQTVTVRVIKLEKDKRRVGLSMKEAQGGAPLSRGTRVKGTVNRIERYGVFLELEDGQSALLPAAESGTPRGTDMNQAFPMGTVVEAQIIEVDDRGRIKVSKKRREAADERALLDDYNKQQSSGGSGFGTLGDLLKAKLNK